VVTLLNKTPKCYPDAHDNKWYDSDGHLGHCRAQACQLRVMESQNPEIRGIAVCNCQLFESQ